MDQQDKIYNQTPDEQGSDSSSLNQAIDINSYTFKTTFKTSQENKVNNSNSQDDLIMQQNQQFKDIKDLEQQLALSDHLNNSKIYSSKSRSYKFKAYLDTSRHGKRVKINEKITQLQKSIRKSTFGQSQSQNKQIKGFYNSLSKVSKSHKKISIRSINLNKIMPIKRFISNIHGNITSSNKKLITFSQHQANNLRISQNLTTKLEVQLQTLNNTRKELSQKNRKNLFSNKEYQRESNYDSENQEFNHGIHNLNSKRREKETLSQTRSNMLQRFGRSRLRLIDRQRQLLSRYSLNNYRGQMKKCVEIKIRVRRLR